MRLILEKLKKCFSSIYSFFLAFSGNSFSSVSTESDVLWYIGALKLCGTDATPHPLPQLHSPPKSPVATHPDPSIALILALGSGGGGGVAVALPPARGVAGNLDLRNPVALQGTEQLYLRVSHYTLTLRVCIARGNLEKYPKSEKHPIANWPQIGHLLVCFFGRASNSRNCYRESANRALVIMLSQDNV